MGKKVNLEELVYNRKTKHKEGFTDVEIFRLILEIGGTFHVDRYLDAMLGNTCMLNGDDIINYHCDVLTALRCGYEDRGIRAGEFD